LFLALGGARREGVVERARRVGGARHCVVVVVVEENGMGVSVDGRVSSREARPRRAGRVKDMAAV
jgi:hypothetical protein